MKESISKEYPERVHCKHDIAAANLQAYVAIACPATPPPNHNCICEADSQLPAAQNGYPWQLILLELALGVVKVSL